jgi:hypothetical protein
MIRAFMAGKRQTQAERTSALIDLPEALAL